MGMWCRGTTGSSKSKGKGPKEGYLAWEKKCQKIFMAYVEWTSLGVVEHEVKNVTKNPINVET